MKRGIPKQPEPPRRPGDYTTAKGTYNSVPTVAPREADEIHTRDLRREPGGAPPAGEASG